MLLVVVIEEEMDFGIQNWELGLSLDWRNRAERNRYSIPLFGWWNKHLIPLFIKWMEWDEL